MIFTNKHNNWQGESVKEEKACDNNLGDSFEIHTVRECFSPLSTWIGSKVIRERKAVQRKSH